MLSKDTSTRKATRISRMELTKAREKGKETNPDKKCTFCNKFGHRAETCYTPQTDIAPCYNTKGELFYPKGENPGTSSGPANNGFKPAVPIAS